MAKVFGEYASFYDSYYADKDYEREVDFVVSLAKAHTLANPRSVLDVGCGTGGHLIPFGKRGLSAKGIDLSAPMLEIAKQTIASAGVESHAKVELGDVTSYRDGKKYDMVVSMFAVMGYLTTNESLLAGLRTARAHLGNGGLFIFDVWFGPTVLNQLPETRIQEFIIDGHRTIRLVRPDLDVTQSVVQVNYDIMKFTSSNTVEEVHEVHHMRYFFIQELMLFLSLAEFELSGVCPFLDSTRGPKLGDWNICVVAKAM